MIERTVNTTFGSQLEFALRRAARAAGIPLNVQVYLIGSPESATQCLVQIQTALTAPQIAALDGVISAFVPDDRVDQDRQSLRLALRRLVAARDRWGSLSPAQKDQVLQDLLAMVVTRIINEVGDQL